MANINFYVYHESGVVTAVELYKQTQPGVFISLVDDEANVDADLIISDYKVVSDALVEMSQAEKDAKAAPETLENELIWVAGELNQCDIMAAYYRTGDTARQTATEAAWNTYAVELRDYISNDGTINGSRPVAPV